MIPVEAQTIANAFPLLPISTLISSILIASCLIFGAELIMRMLVNLAFVIESAKLKHFIEWNSKFEPLTFDPKPPRKLPDKSNNSTRPIQLFIKFLMLIVTSKLDGDTVPISSQAMEKLAFDKSVQFEFSNLYDLPEPINSRARAYSSKVKLVSPSSS